MAKLINEYLRETYGGKVYKIALNGGFTCPTRDGTKGTRGCIFCSGLGSGEFAEDPCLSITEQIEKGKKRIEAKAKNARYIAYFQAFTGTYAPIEKLEKLYMEAASHPEVVIISIATRPDCLDDRVLDLLARVNQIKPVWVELGLQTIYEKTAIYIRRGYDLNVYYEAVQKLKERNIPVITHVILGLPGETDADMLKTIRYVCDSLPPSPPSGIKLQLLHVLKDTDLEKEYSEGKVPVMTEDEYIALLQKCVAVIPENVIIHRLTGDGDKRILRAPLWSGNKKRVWNRIRKEVLHTSS